MRVLIVEDEPDMAEAVRSALRLEAIAADVAGDGDTALELLAVNDYDIAVLDRDIPGPSGDEVAERIVAAGTGMPILMLTAADRLDDLATGFALGADDYLTKPSRCVNSSCGCAPSTGVALTTGLRSSRPPASPSTRSAARSTVTAAMSP